MRQPLKYMLGGLVAALITVLCLQVVTPPIVDWILRAIGLAIGAVIALIVVVWRKHK